MDKRNQSGEPVVVFVSSRQDDFALAQSILRSCEMAFCTEGEHIAGKFAYGGLGGWDNITGGMKILVAAEDAEDAREALLSLVEGLAEKPSSRGNPFQ